MSRSLAEGFVKLIAEPPNIVFIHGQNCMGCTTSMMYGNDFDFVEFLSRFGHLASHPSLSFHQGDEYLANFEKVIESGDALLIVEGSIPVRPREACYFGEKPLYDVLASYAAKAKFVIASGSCASYGGIPASGNNPTGALSVEEYFEQLHVTTPLLRIPGCPGHPDHILGSVAYIAATGELPPLDKESKLNKEYFSETIHNRCSRFQKFTQDVFVSDFSKDKDGCLIKKGCRGPITKSDCPLRKWNQRTNVCVDSNTPCVGCMTKSWPFKSDIYLSSEEIEDLPWSQMKKKINNRE